LPFIFSNAKHTNHLRPLFQSDPAGTAVAEAIKPIIEDQEMLRQFAMAICTTQDEDMKVET